MNHNEVLDRLSNYIDGLLPADERQGIDAHLQSCPSCSAELSRLHLLLSKAAALPREIQPQRDLWGGVAKRIQPRYPNVIPFPSVLIERRDGTQEAQGHRLRDHRVWIRRSLSIAAAFLAAFGSFWLTLRSPSHAWEVVRLQGAPRLGNERLEQTGRLRVGDWLETDESSRAVVTIANIGQAEIGPKSRMQLVATRETEHRLALVTGEMRARVWSPPRIFIVETPSGTAVDLGCAYDLTVDEGGNGLLHVASGEVSLEFNGRESFVPAGTLCETRPGVGPGTPYSDLSNETIRSALRKFDFENGASKSLNAILREATNVDAITLWHLLSRTDGEERVRVCEKFSSLIPPPKGVTREGILRLDKNMLEDWLDVFAVRSFSVSRFLSKK